MKWTISLVGVASVLFVLSYVLVPQLTALEYSSVRSDEKAEAKEITSTPHTEEIPVDTREVITHVPLPTPLRAIYMTSCVAGTTDFRNDLVTLVDETEI